MEQSKKPIIGTVHDHLLGRGVEVALYCHYRLFELSKLVLFGNKIFFVGSSLIPDLVVLFEISVLIHYVLIFSDFILQQTGYSEVIYAAVF